MTHLIRILIADDHHIVRGGLQAILDFEEDMQVVGQASDGEEAVEQYALLKPDVVIMDLVMPYKDGVEAISDIRTADPEARILALTSYSETNKVLLAMKAGAMGYLLKNTSPGELIQTVREIDSGGMVIQPAILQALFRQTQNTEPSGAQELTSREHEVLKLVAHGKTNDEIAAALSISKRTVNVHITNIMSKLNLANRAQMALFALQHGVIGLFSIDGSQ